jgi:hypothetical protein
MSDDETPLPQRLIYPSQLNYLPQPKGRAMPDPSYLWDPFPTDLPDVGIIGHRNASSGNLGKWKVPTICAAVLALVLGLALALLAACFVGKRMRQHQRHRQETREFHRMPEQT